MAGLSNDAALTIGAMKQMLRPILNKLEKIDDRVNSLETTIASQPSSPSKYGGRASADGGSFPDRLRDLIGLAAVEQKFEVGQRVEVANTNPGFAISGAKTKKKGRWYPGVITVDRNDNTYDVMYDDGEKEIRIASTNIRSQFPGSSSAEGRLTSKSHGMTIGIVLHLQEQRCTMILNVTITECPEKMTVLNMDSLNVL